VGAAAAIVGAQIICADDAAVRLGDEHGVSRRAPVGERLGPRDIARDRIGLAGAEGRLQDVPDGIVVLAARGLKACGRLRLVSSLALLNRTKHGVAR
jgi:hypothetical protein